MSTALACALLGPLASAAVFDLRERRIPNSLVLFMVTVWFVLMLGTGISSVESTAVWAMLAKGLAGAVLLGGGSLVLAWLYENCCKRPSLGGGDIKLLFALGLYLGPWNGLLCLLGACLGAIILALVIPHTRFANVPGGEAGSVPFAPALLLGAVACLLV